VAPLSDAEHRARALAAERAHVRRYRVVQKVTRIALALAAIAALTLAWWLGTRLD
jgi:hypothetical protein